MVLEKKIDALSDGRPKADDGEGNVEMGRWVDGSWVRIFLLFVKCMCSTFWKCCAGHFAKQGGYVPITSSMCQLSINWDAGGIGVWKWLVSGEVVLPSAKLCCLRNNMATAMVPVQLQSCSVEWISSWGMWHAQHGIASLSRSFDFASNHPGRSSVH